MAGRSGEKAWRLWAAITLTALSILGMVPLARPLQNWIKGTVGSGIFIVFTLVFVAIGLEIFRRIVIIEKARNPVRIFIFFLVAGLYAWRLVTLPLHVERFHLIEYGLLGVLITLACNRKNPDFLAPGWGLAAAWLLGMTDEFFQWVWPDRVGEWRDVVINIQSAALAIAALIFLGFLPGIRHRPSRRAAGIFLFIIAVLCLLSGGFFLKVHVFGHRLTDPGIGTFNSFFSREQLSLTHPENYAEFVMETDKIAASIGALDHRRYFYDREAREHFDRTHLLIELDRIKEAKNEYLLTLTYYNAYLEFQELRFPPELEALMTRTEPIPPPQFSSRVMDWLVVDFTAQQIRNISGGSTLFFAMIASFCLFIGKRCRSR